MMTAQRKTSKIVILQKSYSAITDSPENIGIFSQIKIALFSK